MLLPDAWARIEDTENRAYLQSDQHAAYLREPRRGGRLIARFQMYADGSQQWTLRDGSVISRRNLREHLAELLRQKAKL